MSISPVVDSVPCGGQGPCQALRLPGATVPGDRVTSL
jgi:hypothetical protein